jgi:predicted molibdopterin-dependent oxidoreductase YjgC
MQILINNKEVDCQKDETLLEIADRIGYSIPSMCYAKDAVHKSSCMVCVVRDCKTQQIIPSCTTFAVEGMEIDTESEEVMALRKMSLELLLSDHRADCDAPCSMVCPHGLDIEKVLYFYDNDNNKAAYDLIDNAFSLPTLGCEDCKVPCEKICRRKSIDQSIPIRQIIKEIAGLYDTASTKVEKKEKSTTKQFQSLLGRFTENEKVWLKNNVDTLSACLHCACEGSDGCKLRLYASQAGIKRSRYEAYSSAMVMQRQHITGKMWLEPSKCVRCGLCVYNSKDGFTFKDRGFGMEVIMPEESRKNVSEDIAKLCPTGALYIRKV